MNKVNTLSILLGISMVANGFFMGFMSSRVSSFGERNKPMHQGMHKPPFEGFSNIKGFDKEHKDIVDSFFIEHKENMHKSLQNMHSLFGKLNASLSAEVFNEEDSLSIMKEVDAADAKIKENFSKFILKTAKTLPNEQRIKFFKGFSKEQGFMPPPPPMIQGHMKRPMPQGGMKGVMPQGHMKKHDCAMFGQPKPKKMGKSPLVQGEK